MASFNVVGLDDLMLSMSEIASMPDSVLVDMLAAETEVVVEAQKVTAPENTGTMANSIAPNKNVRKYNGIHVDIYPQGTHHISKKSRYRTGGKNRTVTNAEVGFIHEFGAKGRNIKASQWMQKANAKSIDEAVLKAQEVYHDFLTSKNL